jgi:hypothetical protein
MPTSVLIELNHAGMAELLKDHSLYAALEPPASRVLAAAVSGAPVESGAYRRGLHIERAVTNRVVVRVSGSTDHDMVVEANTGNLGRALGNA